MTLNYMDRTDVSIFNHHCAMRTLRRVPYAPITPAERTVHRPLDLIMSVLQPPSTQDPFTLRLDESLAMSEDNHAGTHFNCRSPESMSTIAPDAVQPVPEDTASTKPAVMATQALLQSACRRKRLSSSGTKQQLAKRLENIGVSTALQVRSLAVAFASNGPDESQQTSGKPKAPNWTMNEAAGLCHVLADPRHATAGRRYNKMETRAEIDIGKHDPWSAEFVDLFNCPEFLPDVPDGRDGVTEALLLSFDPTLHPHKRSGTFLKGRWNKLRSKYTIAREKYTKSGQGENDVFESFTDGDDTLCYMHCVFYGLPALEAVVRALHEDCGVEAGLEEISQARSASQDLPRRNKRRKTQDENSIAEGPRDVARAVTAPVEININDKPESVTTGKFHEFDMSNRIAGTVTKLMTLEDTIRSNLRQAPLDGDEEYIEELRGRLTNVQRRIDRALME